LFWFVKENCPSSDTELELHESVPSLLSSWVGNFFQIHTLEDYNAEMNLEEIGWEGKDLTCPKTGTSG
jgi:hypothetical protein